MPKAISIAPPVNTSSMPEGGITVRVTDVRITTDQWTSIGTVKRAIGLTVEYEHKEYSQLFSIDKPTLTGSIGRILVSLDIEDTETSDFDEKLKRIIGKEIRVLRKGGKVYWYP